LKEQQPIREPRNKKSTYCSFSGALNMPPVYVVDDFRSGIEIRVCWECSNNISLRHQGSKERKNEVARKRLETAGLHANYSKQGRQKTVVKSLDG